MTRPTKVLSFFFLPGLAPAPAPAWDPSLAMVALGGLVPNIFVWNKVLARWKRPIENDKWECPPVATGRIDAKLVLGSAMFGIGWGACFPSLLFFSRLEDPLADPDRLQA